MSESLAALIVISAIVGVGGFVGLYAGTRHKMDMEQWIVAGRGFGVIFVWLLMAGEVYTTFTFLGASGWAYSRGGPVFYILAYQPLIYVVSFYVLPQMWEAGKRFRLQTQADFFRVRYGSKSLEAFVALVGVVFLIPYLQLQVTGLGLIVEVASFGGIRRTPAMVISFAIVAAFVFTSGVRGAAWVSVLKDFLLLFAALFVGFAIPYHYFGGIGPMFTALIRAKPQHLVMPGATNNLGHAWFVSTVIMTALAFFMWPQYVGACFTARSGDTIRRNAVIMPLYSITMPLMFVVGFTALLVVPGLADSNLALLTIVRKTFPPWFLGIIGGAGALTAMVPAAVQLLTASTLFIKNFCSPIFAPSMTDIQVARAARATVLGIAALALGFAIYSDTTLVALLLLGYAGVVQLFPGVVFGLYSRRVTAGGIFAAMAAGIAVVAFLVLTKRDPFMGFNAGFLGLCVNLVIVAVARLLTSARPTVFDEPAQAQSA
ncbi:MAG TPA: sodium:solute symporter family protein [Candidatus Acidoferrum sp.]|nr:sodium:solute symporter family protein [Candidatus Acidoferrum sp.]